MSADQQSPLPADPQIIIDGMTVAHAEAEKHVAKLVRERDELRAAHARLADRADRFRELAMAAPCTAADHRLGTRPGCTCRGCAIRREARDV